ncbi:MAG TPA: hypothetical protein VK880_14220 [Anaerolineales bacterium]|nr:hypothetical protein [Anaerolineales bacterium]
MEILGIGLQEIVFILIIALIVLGPRDMQKAGRTIGRWLNQLVRSDFWKVFQKTSVELRNLPRNLMREANTELGDVNEEIQEIRQTIDPRSRPPVPPPGRNPTPSNQAGASPQPPTPSPSPNSPPSNPTEATPQPPAADPTDAPDETKQDD